MAKPVGDVRWASEEDALKEDPSATQRELGWIATTGPVKPNLQQQNGWQNLAYRWIGLLDDSTPDELGDTLIVDLWRWDSASYMRDDPDQSFVNITTSIEVDGTKLTWFRDNASVGQEGNGSTWLDFQPESYYGSMLYEFEDMIGRGIAIKIVDAAQVIWTIFNTNGTGLVEGGSRPGTCSGDLTSAVVADRILTFSIESTSPNISIQRDAAGVITFPSDFTGFVEVNFNNWFSTNFDGIRAVLYGEMAIDILSGNQSVAKYPIKKWILPAINSQAIQKPSPQLRWRFPFLYGQRYHARFLFDSTTVASVPFDSSISLDDFGPVEVGSYALSTDNKWYQMDCIFYGERLRSSTERQFVINSSTGLTLVGGGNPIDVLYENVQASNILIIEEMP